MSFNKEEPVKTFVVVKNKGLLNETREYFAYVERTKITITKELFQFYQSTLRHERYVRARDAEHNLVSYHAEDSVGDLDESVSGEETIVDTVSTPVEDRVVMNLLTEKLPDCLKLLSDEEYALIKAFFFEGISERDLATRWGIPRMTLACRKKKILSKLKEFLEN
ncbi:MAG: hypothetical protein R3Y63_13210 [Eubacteriales bacterium]